jgi:uncharacterized protein (TIGR02391 family)
MNYRLIATRIGDCTKYGTSLKEIDRLAHAIFRFEHQSFPLDAISSQRAQRVYDWIMTLGRQSMLPGERDKLLLQFCRGLAPEEQRDAVDSILLDAGLPASLVRHEEAALFASRDLHPVVHMHARKLFVQGHYFHAVFEAAKAFHSLVQAKAQSARDGQALMLEVWSPDKGVLKMTPCVTETDRNVQSGIGFLSAGLMAAVRNPTAHEPALDWPINRQDALDLLTFISFLLRQADKAVHVPRPAPGSSP